LILVCCLFVSVSCLEIFIWLDIYFIKQCQSSIVSFDCVLDRMQALLLLDSHNCYLSKWL